MKSDNKNEQCQTFTFLPSDVVHVGTMIPCATANATQYTDAVDNLQFHGPVHEMQTMCLPEKIIGVTCQR